MFIQETFQQHESGQMNPLIIKDDEEEEDNNNY